MKTIAIIPTYNEKENIKLLIPLIRKECTNTELDILVVDSNSPDGTADVVSEIAASDTRVHLLKQSKKMGLGKAYLEGMRSVLSQPYDAVITMDADLSHHPKYLNEMLLQLETHDLVIGSRYIPGGDLRDWPMARILLSRFANWYAKTLTGIPASDLTSGFQGFKTELLRNVLRYPLRADGYAFLISLKFWSAVQQARVKEVPIIFTDRTHGTTKISKRVVFESVFFVWKIFFQRWRIKTDKKYKPALPERA